MDKKKIGILICMLLIASAVPVVESLKNNAMNTTVPSPSLSSMTSWNETQKLVASDGQQEDNFGFSVSLDGDTALIGARYDDDNGTDSGSAYVFTYSGPNWTQQQRLLANGEHASENDNFGWSVSLDGDTALIGAPGDIGNSGSAYVFIRTGTTWTQQQRIYITNATDGDYFGHAVSLDRDTALIGAYGDDSSRGAVYVFTRTGTTWTQQAELHASDGTGDDMFGWSVSLDGDTALIGAQGVKEYTGSAYVFTRTGNTWIQQQNLNYSEGKEYDYFGHAVFLDGNTALIGADEHTLVTAHGTGHMNVFIRTGTNWTQQQRFNAIDSEFGDMFGTSVSLFGNTMLVGARFDDDNGGSSGSAYVFTYNGTTWWHYKKILASDGKAEDNFGRSVSYSGDTVFIGAFGNAGNTGAVYVFKNEGNQQPYPPKITGKASGRNRVTYDYNFMTIDPDDDNVFYFIDWGDGTNSDLIGPFPSGDQITQSHKWSIGLYIIKAKAMDSLGAESEWGTLSVTMPTSYNQPLLQFLELLFQRFPNAFPLLRQLMGY